MDHPLDTRIATMLITNRTDYAQRAVAGGVDRIFLDLELLGKRERQRGRNTHITTHEVADVSRMRTALPDGELLVRVNPVHAGSADEIERVIDAGADLVMLPMFRTAAEVSQFVGMVDGRCRTVLLFETAAAVARTESILRAHPAVDEAYLGLNDLHLDLGLSFMFEPLAGGLVDGFAAACHRTGTPFGFGGIARVGEGALPAERVLAEHVRLGSTRVILSRTFQQSPADGDSAFPTDALKLLKLEEDRIRLLDRASLAESHRDLVRIVSAIVAGEAPQVTSLRPEVRMTTACVRVPAVAMAAARPAWERAFSTWFPNHLLCFRALDDAPPPDTEVLVSPADQGLPRAMASIADLRHLHLLSSGADGVDELDIPRDRLRVTTSVGVNAASIADHVMAGLLSWRRGLGEADQAQRDRAWRRTWLREFSGAWAGILGAGAVAAELAPRLRAHGLRVWATRRTRSHLDGADVTLRPGEETHLLPRTAVLVVALPLTASTTGAVDAKMLGSLQRGAFVAHVSRGGVVCEEALLEALASGQAGGALLDVFSEEPLPPESPLWTAQGLRITPHVAGTTQHYQERAAALFVQLLRGRSHEKEPPHGP